MFHSPVADYSGRDNVAHLFPELGQCPTGIEPVQGFPLSTPRTAVSLMREALTADPLPSAR